MSDDDIMDLTAIVRPGAAQQNVQAAPDTADLGTRPADGHVVDPNEKIDLPLLSDLDALLEELGVAEQPKAAAPLAPKAEPSFDDLDADILNGNSAPEQTAPAQATAVGQAASAQTVQSAELNPDSDILDLVEILPSPAQKTQAPSAATPAPQAAPAAVQAAPASVQAGPAARAQAVDLDEINALVDDLQPSPTSPAHPAQTKQAPAPQAAPVKAPATQVPASQTEAVTSATGVRATAPAAPASQIEQDIASILEDVSAATAAPPAPAPVAPPKPAPAPVAAPKPVPASVAAPKPAPAAPAAASPAPAPSAPIPASPPSTAQEKQDDDGIDMDELDAMLDQVLSVAPKNTKRDVNRTAPAPAVVPVSAPAPAPVKAPVKPAVNVPAPAAKTAAADPVAPVPAEPEIPAFDDVDVGAMLAEADIKQKTAPSQLAHKSTVTVQRTDASAPAIHQVPAPALKITPVAKQAAHTRVAQNSSNTAQSAAMQEAQAADHAALTRAQAEIRRLTREMDSLRVENNEFKTRVTALSSELVDLRSNIDKHAARAAAKVIREELMPALSSELN
jgi:hypothetical protein